jgi:CRP/FNR family transcriptional regulator, anaerobic regulatory protein
MDSSHVFTIGKFSRACTDCQLQDLCFPMGLSREEIDQLNRIVSRRSPLQRGTPLFKQGGLFGSLFAVRSGSIKSFTTEDGIEQTIAFHLPGEILGLDAIGEGRHQSTAVALETASICELPYDRLYLLAREIDGLQHQLLRIMSRKLAADDQFKRLVTRHSAEGRLAGFLLNLASRYALRGYSSSEFNLSMFRSDIGNYLGLAVETVSRTFTHFQHDGLIDVQGKTIKILRRDTLEIVAGNSARLDFFADDLLNRTGN